MDAQTVHERRWLILGVMSLSLVITLLNNVTVNVALPELSKDLGADNTELQWIMDAYVVVFGGMLLVMGAGGSFRAQAGSDGRPSSSGAGFCTNRPVRHDI